MVIANRVVTDTPLSILAIVLKLYLQESDTWGLVLPTNLHCPSAVIFIRRFSNKVLDF